MSEDSVGQSLRAAQCQSDIVAHADPREHFDDIAFAVTRLVEPDDQRIGVIRLVIFRDEEAVRPEGANCVAQASGCASPSAERITSAGVEWCAEAPSTSPLISSRSDADRDTGPNDRGKREEVMGDSLPAPRPERVRSPAFCLPAAIPFAVG